MAGRGPRPRIVLGPGDVVGELTVIEEQDGRTIKCRCSCGNVKDIRAADLRRVKRPTKTCGHLVPAPTLKVDADMPDGLCRCCDEEADVRGLCSLCYGRAEARGVLDEVALDSRASMVQYLPAEKSPFWMGDTVDYNGAHARIRRIRGKASDRVCAEPICDNQAVSWSYDGYCPEERVCPDRGAPYCYHYERHYQARCLPCHKDWDRDEVIVAAR